MLVIFLLIGGLRQTEMLLILISLVYICKKITNYTFLCQEISCLCSARIVLDTRATSTGDT